EQRRQPVHGASASVPNIPIFQNVSAGGTPPCQAHPARGSGLRTHRRLRGPEPPGAPAGPEVVLLNRAGRRRLPVRPDRRGPREEVDVDASDTTPAELDVAGATPV